MNCWHSRLQQKRGLCDPRPNCNFNEDKLYNKWKRLWSWLLCTVELTGGCQFEHCSFKWRSPWPCLIHNRLGGPNDRDSWCTTRDSEKDKAACSRKGPAGYNGTTETASWKQEGASAVARGLWEGSPKQSFLWFALTVRMTICTRCPGPTNFLSHETGFGTC